MVPNNINTLHVIDSKRKKDNNNIALRISLFNT